MILLKYIWVFCSRNTKFIKALDCFIDCAKYTVQYVHVLLSLNLKLKVCFLPNLLLVKIKQAIRLNVQIKSDCLSSLLVIVLSRVKIEHAFEFTVLCAIQLQLVAFMRCQPDVSMAK